MHGSLAIHPITAREPSHSQRSWRPRRSARIGVATDGLLSACQQNSYRRYCARLPAPGILGWTTQAIAFRTFTNFFFPVLSYFAMLSVAMGVIAHVAHIVLSGYAGIHLAAAHTLGHIPAACQAVILPATTTATLLGTRSLGASGELQALDCVGGLIWVTFIPASVAFGLTTFSLIPLFLMLERCIDAFIIGFISKQKIATPRTLPPTWEPRADGSVTLRVILDMHQNVRGDWHTLGATLSRDSDLFLYSQGSPLVKKDEILFENPKIYCFRQGDDAQIELAAGSAKSLAFQQFHMLAVGTRCPLSCTQSGAFLSIVLSTVGFLIQARAWRSNRGSGPPLPWLSARRSWDIRLRKAFFPDSRKYTIHNKRTRSPSPLRSDR